MRRRVIGNRIATLAATAFAAAALAQLPQVGLASMDGQDDGQKGHNHSQYTNHCRNLACSPEKKLFARLLHLIGEFTPVIYVPDVQWIPSK